MKKKEKIKTVELTEEHMVVTGIKKKKQKQNQKGIRGVLERTF